MHAHRGLSPAAEELASRHRTPADDTGVATVKAVLLGESGRGKTAALRRLLLDEYDAAVAETIGVDFLTKRIALALPNGDREQVRAQFWDTGGRERYRTLLPAYVRGVAVCVIVYDASAGSRAEPEEIEMSASTLGAAQAARAPATLAPRERRVVARFREREYARVWLAWALERTHAHCAVLVLGTKTDLVVPRDGDGDGDTGSLGADTAEAQRESFAALVAEARASDPERHIGFAQLSSLTRDGLAAARQALGDTVRAYMLRSGLIEREQCVARSAEQRRRPLEFATSGAPDGDGEARAGGRCLVACALL